MRVSDLNIDRVYINSVIRGKDFKMVENHFHYYYELFYVKSGSCRCFIYDNLYEMKGGDFIVIPPREPHYNKYNTQCERINIYFNEEDLDDDGRPIVENLKEKFLSANLTHIPRAYRSTIDNVLESMLKEDKVDDESTKVLMQLMLKEFLLYCNRCCVAKAGKTVSDGDMDSDILRSAQYITEHYNQNITLESLSKSVNLSPSYFSRRFRQITGCGMKEYLCHTRLTHAALELISTDHSVTEVSMNSGFSDSNYFKDAFKKEYGLSPRAYRNSKTTDYLLAQSMKRDKENV